MLTVQVLCPNGRRQNVKITPNTKILQILEEVCQKQKFLPTTDYNLIHGRKTLDITLSVRYTNLPNNAKLELMKAQTTREETEVTIALQLENGERLQHTFSPTTSLWDLLLYWESQTDRDLKGQLAKVITTEGGTVQTSCIYMREEVIGELALKETKLRSLGLTGGKAVIRLTHRSVDEDTLAQINEKIVKEKQRKEKLEQTALVSSSGSGTQPAVTQTSTSAPLQETSETSSTQTQSSDSRVPASSSIALSDDIQQAGPSSQSNNKNKSPDPVEPMDIDQSECPGVSMDVDKVGTGARSKTAGSTQGALKSTTQNEHIDRLRALNIPGVQIFSPGDFHDLPPDQQQVANDMMQAYFASMAAGADSQTGVKQNKNALPKKSKPTSVPFADFKFPEDTKGKDLYTNELSIVKKDDLRPCDRQTVVYSLEESLGVDASKTELPEDFFELTESDLKRLAVDQRKRLAEYEDQPLMTSAMRHQHVVAQYDRYDKVVIRVQFPDKMVLQGMFRPQETVFAVQKFVKEHIEDKSTPFYLYTSPPKLVFTDVSQTMIEAKLVPASVVYFGSEDTKEHHLSDAVMSTTSPRIKADEVVNSCFSDTVTDDPIAAAHSQSRTSSESTTRSSDSGPSGTTSRRGGSTTTSDTKGEAKNVPKWFKIGKT